jgi:hypothetical protein
MTQDRYQIQRAAARIHTYYTLQPHEVALGKTRPAFDRAKARWIQVAQESLDEVKAMTFEEYMAIRNPGTARRPHECPECGHDSSEATAKLPA